MRTWSIEGVLDGLLAGLRTIERRTRPPKMGFHDYDAEYTGQAAGIAADALADREAEEEVGIGTGLDGIDENLTEFIKQTIGPMTCCGELFVHAADCPQGELHKCTEDGCTCQHDDRYRASEKYPDPGTGCIDDGAPQQVTLSGREYERYLDGALNEQPSACPQCNDTRRCGPFVCTACLVPDVYADYVRQRYTQAQLKEMRDEGWEFHAIPEPDLTADELVAVRQLIDERFPIFAGAAASLADDNNSPGVLLRSSVREDKQRLASPADPQSDLSPAATPGAGDTAPDSVAPPAESGAIPLTPGAASVGSSYAAGYYIAVEIVERLAAGDRRMADALPDGVGEASATALEECARYLRGIGPSNKK